MHDICTHFKAAARAAFIQAVALLKYYCHPQTFKPHKIQLFKGFLFNFHSTAIAIFQGVAPRHFVSHSHCIAFKLACAVSSG